MKPPHNIIFSVFSENLALKKLNPPKFDEIVFNILISIVANVTVMIVISLLSLNHLRNSELSLISFVIIVKDITKLNINGTTKNTRLIQKCFLINNTCKKIRKKKSQIYENVKMYLGMYRFTSTESLIVNKKSNTTSLKITAIEIMIRL